MLSSSIDKLLKVSKTTSPQKLSAYDCVTLYICNMYVSTKLQNLHAVDCKRY